MRTPTPHAPRGFTILETMMAMVVLGVSLLGTLGALSRGATESRLGQTRQMKMMLADAALQRVRLQDKDAFFAGLPAQPTVDLGSLAVGATPWVLDPTSSADPLDFSQGTYFDIKADGTLVKLNFAGNPACNNAAIPVGTICREVYTHLGAPYSATNATMAVALPRGARVATAWVRVSRKTAATSPLDAEVDVLLNAVVVQ